MFIGLFAGLQSCKEIIATDISETVPVLILPQANDTLQNNPVHFKWEEVDGAEKYHLQIVSKSFANIESYEIDSMITGTSVYISLDSNAYELKLTAMNAGYSSHTLGPVKFQVGVPASESSNSVTLISPAAGSYFNEDYLEAPGFEGIFEWGLLSGADSYEFSLRRGTGFASGTVVESVPGIETSQHELDETLTEGQYWWGVRAIYSSGSETTVSTRKFYIDTYDPVVPTLVSPSSTVQAGNVTFTWTNATDPGTIKSPVSAIVEVDEDMTFTANPETATFSSGNGTVSGTFELLGSGTRYWRVKNVDAAGNVSSYSSIGQFTLTP